MTPKNEKFHSLAVKRTANIVEAVRIFSNLSSNNYDWTGYEVDGYFDEIQRAVADARFCFSSQKRWGSIDEAIAEIFASQAEEEVPLTPEQHRRVSITETIRAAKDDREALAEMVFMQGKVIEDLKCKLEKLAPIVDHQPAPTRGAGTNTRSKSTQPLNPN